ncbi:MAG: hypothetical protein H7177_18160 [Rhizobacter sp.]|nr:hypothetical protein [Bacteriovorax sp.]
MAKLQNSDFLKNKKGQSVVEYILLLAVISTIAFSFYNNRRFKEFMGGKTGLFAYLRQGMEYSYHYGREYKIDEGTYDESMDFNYSTNKHDTYFDRKTNRSRFFAGINAYGKMD